MTRVLEWPEIRDLLSVYGREAVTVQIQDELASWREELQRRLDGLHGLDRGGASPSAAENPMYGREGLVRAVRSGLGSRWGAPAQRVLNATGVFLHTNLGRAPLSRATLLAIDGLLDASSDVEFDLVSGTRGDRNRRVSKLLAGIVGSPSALVVNNNAGALVLILASLSDGHERPQVLVSRGELVEIGGSFRIPDILRAAGCELVEVGTTNRTRIEDYRRAITEHTAMLLKVHPSNYRVRGFTEETSAAELVRLGEQSKLPVVVDEGSGLLVPTHRSQLRDHSSLRELIEAGVTLACGSGDKLLGGPQAGLICGAEEPIRRLHRHPLYRALRPSRQILVTLEVTLRTHLRGDDLPIDRLWQDERTLERRLETLRTRVAGVSSNRESVIAPGEAFVGGGAAPDQPIEGPVLRIADDGRLSRRLRHAPTPVVGYLRDGHFVLDLRTVDPACDQELAESVCWALSSLDTSDPEEGAATPAAETERFDGADAPAHRVAGAPEL